MKELILMRGLPGAGKSTLTAILAGEARKNLFSVDDYFTSLKGEYNFEFEQNHLAYKRCEANTKEAMERNESRIFVHNTFVYEWEMEPYFEMASQFNYRIHVITVENRHKGLNVHGVSQDQIEKMASKFGVVLY